MPEEKQIEVVDQFVGSLAVFDPLKAEIAKYKEKNASMVFQYETAKGEADARSWCFKLRRLKGPLTEIHKIAKAKALAHCQAVDGEKNWCFSEVDEMVKVHMDPIDRKIKRQKNAKAAAAEKLQLEKESEEKARLKAIEDREAAIKVEEDRLSRLWDEEKAKIDAEKERLAKIEAERQAKIRKESAEREAANQKIQDEVDAKHQAESERLAKIAEANERIRKDEEAKAKVKALKLAAERAKFEAEKKAEADAVQRAKIAREAEAAKARAETEKKEQERLGWIKAEKDEKKRLADEEAKRVADNDHRMEIETDVHKVLWDVIDKMTKFNTNDSWNRRAQLVAVQVRDAIAKGKIPHVKIIY